MKKERGKRDFFTSLRDLFRVSDYQAEVLAQAGTAMKASVGLGLPDVSGLVLSLLVPKAREVDDADQAED